MQDENDDASSNVSSFYVFDFHENNEQVERKLHSIAFFGEGPPGPRVCHVRTAQHIHSMTKTTTTTWGFKMVRMAPSSAG